MPANEKLLAALKARKSQGPFGRGILTADHFVKNVQDCVGVAACYRYAATREKSFDDVLKKAAKTTAYYDPANLAKRADQKADDLAGIEFPKDTLVTFKHTLTTPRQDRDGDIMRSEGAEVDPKMLLLWQHVHTLPIGKVLHVAEQGEKGVSLVSAIVDINDVAHDAAVMVDNDMARFSHGFRALEFEEMKSAEAGDFAGFDIKRFEVMEASVVSVPANPDAEVEEVLLSLVEGGKLTSAMSKEWGKTIRDKRPTASTVRYKETAGDYSREIEAPNAATFEQVFTKTKEADKDDKPCGCNEVSGKPPCGEAGASEEADTAQAQAEGQQTPREAAAADPEMKFIGGGYVSGSWEWIESQLRDKAKKHLAAGGVSMGEHDWVYLAGTFPDKAIIGVDNMNGDGDRYFETSWSMQDGEPEFSGSLEAVEIVVTTEVKREKGVKSGRVLSQRNASALTEVKADIGELAGMDIPRAGTAICERCINTLDGVLKSAQTDDEEEKQTPADAALTKQDALAVCLSGSLSAEERKRLQSGLEALATIEERDAKAKSVHRALRGR